MTTLSPAIIDTVLSHLAPHFLASTIGDLPAARQAATQMLGAYNVETEEEIRLAAEIVSFSFHALEALSEAAAADVSMNRKLRLRGSAVSLSREAHKSERKLDRLQRTRLTASPQPRQQAPTAQPPVIPDEPSAAPHKPQATPPLAPIPPVPIQATARHVDVAARKQTRQQRRAAKYLERSKRVSDPLPAATIARATGNARHPSAM